MSLLISLLLKNPQKMEATGLLVSCTHALEVGQFGFFSSNSRNDWKKAKKCTNSASTLIHGKCAQLFLERFFYKVLANF